MSLIGSAPGATYRIQFRKEFPFAACSRLADYLANLGITHVYSSPILEARAGSSHGYDVVRYDRVNPELGGEVGFREMASILRERGIGIVLDIVPNHMAVGRADNPLWLDCLKRGSASRYASWFDIDFSVSDAGLIGKIHAPFLGRSLPEALNAGALKLRKSQHGEGYEIAYEEYVFPIREEDDADIRHRGIKAFDSPKVLVDLLAQQHYVLDHWRSAGDRINWRRFFDITHLAAMRMEEPAAFHAAHAIPLRFYEDGLIDGLRIDHIDGLSDPEGYCRKLRQELDARAASRPESSAKGRAWLLVEKILAPGESIPTEWDVDGSTGYDFMDEVSAIQHDAGASHQLARHWSEISGRSAFFEDEEATARGEILDSAFDGARERLVDLVTAAAGCVAVDEGITRGAMRRAITDALVHMRAYRGYTQRTVMAGALDPRVDASINRAMAHPLAERRALELLREVLSSCPGERESCAKAIMRFSHLSAPLAAKAVEDTAFYRYGKLLSRNDVGFNAGLQGMVPEAFHEAMHARAHGVPRSMLATATHDHKRGEDLRARLAVLSERPDEWIVASRRWRELANPLRPKSVTPADEYLFFQMLAAAWPSDLGLRDRVGLQSLADRLSAWMVKGLREAKLRSSWTQPSSEIEESAQKFVKAALDPDVGHLLIADVARFVDEIARAGAANALAQVALRCLAPGVPDLYQGTEFWDFSLVDPDNRRPVDFERRSLALASSASIKALAKRWRDGHVKQRLLQTLLCLRATMPATFACGSYVRLLTTGPRSQHVLAFMRQGEEGSILVAVARCVADGLRKGKGLTPHGAWWKDTAIILPDDLAELKAIVGRPIAVGLTRLAISEAFEALPVAVWVSPLPRDC
jgi:(1->4)-alpha-D-glucan 1-alpha-D-glucosylmutase